MYVVFYVKDCCLWTKRFKTKSAAIKFADKHEKKNTGEYSDSWVDGIIEGNLVKSYSKGEYLK